MVSNREDISPFMISFVLRPTSAMRSRVAFRIRTTFSNSSMAPSAAMRMAPSGSSRWNVSSWSSQ